MSHDFWRKQDPKVPLFPDVMWSRPEHSSQAGRLLIAGGNSFGFTAPALAFTEAKKAGIGATRVLLPESIRKTIDAFLPEADFAPNNPSGSFAGKALDAFLMHDSWAHATLLAGDFGRNSETAVLLEKFAQRSRSLLAVTQDAADYFLRAPELLLHRPHTTLFLSFEQLQKFATNTHFPEAVTYSMDIIRTAQWLHDFTLKYQATIVTAHYEHFLVAHGGHVVSQHAVEDEKIWRVKRAARGTVFWLQNPAKPLESIASSFLPE